MIELICTECGHRLSFPNQYAGTPRSCHFCGAIVSLPEQLPPAARGGNNAHKSVRLKQKQGPFGQDRNLLIFAGVLIGFAALLCVSGFLTGQTGSPFALTLCVLGLLILATSVAAVCMAIFDVDILSSWTRLSFTVPSALGVFVPAGALGVLTTYFTYSP